MSMYPEIIYGWCLLRILHFISSLQRHRPSLRILIAKYDYSDAYCRIAYIASAAAQTISVHEGLAYLALRLMYDRAPNPPGWTLVSEVVTDLANEISQCDERDPVTLHNPVQPIAPTPIFVPDPTSQLARAEQMSVVPAPILRGKVDGFIDDLILVFWDTDGNVDRLPHAVPLAMYVTSRPHAGDDNEPLPRRDILSIPKLKNEERERTNYTGFRLRSQSFRSNES